MSALVDDLKELYLSWLRDRIQLKDVNGAIEITTPLMDRHNDYIQVYVSKQNPDTFRITDAGYILGDLQLDGIDVQNTPKRREIFQAILNRYGVSCSKSNEIYTDATTNTFPQKKHMLLQSMIAINDMFMTSHSTVSSVFVEDVERFLDEHDIRCTPNIGFVGKTGYTHQFDFVIPKSKSQPERVIKSINSFTKQKTSLLLFSWNDTKEIRGTNSVLYVFLNDLTKPIGSDSLEAFKRYDVKTVLWTKRKEVIHHLSA